MNSKYPPQQRGEKKGQYESFESDINCRFSKDNWGKADLSLLLSVQITRANVVLRGTDCSCTLPTGEKENRSHTGQENWNV